MVGGGQRRLDGGELITNQVTRLLSMVNKCLVALRGVCGCFQ